MQEGTSELSSGNTGNKGNKESPSKEQGNILQIYVPEKNFMHDVSYLGTAHLSLFKTHRSIIGHHKRRMCYSEQRVNHRAHLVLVLTQLPVLSL